MALKNSKCAPPLVLPAKPCEKWVAASATPLSWQSPKGNMKRKPRFDADKVPGFIPLETVGVASPCHADWDAMTGDDRARFCPSCAKNVYNLSAMTEREAQTLIQEKDGHLCIRYFQREDGTMLTQDCPVGAAKWQQKSPAFALWAGVMSLVVAVGAFASPSFISSASAQPETKPTATPLQTATPEPTSTPVPSATLAAPAEIPFMGKISVAPHPAATPAPQPKATPAPQAKATSAPQAPIARMGDMAFSPPPRAVLGRPSIRPSATPAPTAAVEPIMGEAAVQSTAGATATPTAKPKPHPPQIMGLIAVPKPKKPPTSPQPKPGKSAQRSGTSKPKS